ncbi:Uncharacterised protein [Mycobacteroides abscessus subsp. abscessus]|nr:Uncharacterised protein [Mycobacteroides abscessus subsp. abscessus]
MLARGEDGQRTYETWNDDGALSGAESERTESSNCHADGQSVTAAGGCEGRRHRL